MYETVGAGLESSTEFNLAFGCEDPRTYDCAPEALASIPASEAPRVKLCCDRQLYHPEDDGFVTNAVIGAGQKIRIIIDELLRGSTVEQFVCGCADPPENVNANCQGGPTASLDPLNCEDNPNTDVSEASRFSDKDLDGVPDKTDLLPGLVEVYCDGLTVVWRNIAEEGWYNPSGNQQVPANVLDSSATRVILEWDSIGPAIVVSIQENTLPSSSMCHLRIAADSEYPTKDGMVPVQTGRDKDGNPFPTEEIGVDPPLVTFQTEAMRVANTLPMRNATNQPTTLPLISVTFNAKIDPASISGISIADMAGAPVTGTAAVSMDGLSWEFAPSAPLAPNMRYTVTITTTVTDSYGAALPTADTFSFTTGAGA